MTDAGLTVGITTRNRPEALHRCLRSIDAIAHLNPEVLIFDDASNVPVVRQLEATTAQVPWRVVRDERGPGYIAGRNRMVQEANAPFVLLLDDDAAILDGGAIEEGLAILRGDCRVGAIAFAQADRAGARWPEALQPGAAAGSSYVAAFIGFAHIVRRDLFLALGGYRSRFVFYGEEKDFCLRLLDRGCRTVYLPRALVLHDPDPRGRSPRRYLRYVTRNDCLAALYNEPLARVLWLIPARLLLYFWMRRAWRIRDPFGWLWVLREILLSLGSVTRERRPVSRDTLETWASLRRQPVPYDRT